MERDRKKKEREKKKKKRESSKKFLSITIQYHEKK